MASYGSTGWEGFPKIIISAVTAVTTVTAVTPCMTGLDAVTGIGKIRTGLVHVFIIHLFFIVIFIMVLR